MPSEKKQSPVGLTGATTRSAASIETPENRRQLIDMAKRAIAHVEAGMTPSQTDEVVEIPVADFTFVVWFDEADRPARCAAFFDHDQALRTIRDL